MSEPLKKVDMSLLHTIADMDGLPAAGAADGWRGKCGTAASALRPRTSKKFLKSPTNWAIPSAIGAKAISSR